MRLLGKIIIAVIVLALLVQGLMTVGVMMNKTPSTGNGWKFATNIKGRQT